MRRVGQTRRRDTNETPIVRALQAIGCKVKQISEKGFADLVVWHPARGLVLLEVKTTEGAITTAQRQLRREGWPIVIVRSPWDALALFGVAPRPAVGEL